MTQANFRGLRFSVSPFYCQYQQPIISCQSGAGGQRQYLFPILRCDSCLIERSCFRFFYIFCIFLRCLCVDKSVPAIIGITCHYRKHRIIPAFLCCLKFDNRMALTECLLPVTVQSGKHCPVPHIVAVEDEIIIFQRTSGIQKRNTGKTVTAIEILL